ncbi:MAG: heavy metal translocating P-type ATPase [Deltaproteobacteria bacterium]|nr:heavy metal translocating P-type ATPase [Deltaproteobacteria bacterium]
MVLESTDTLAIGAAEKKACFHCGQEDGAFFSENIKGRDLEFCCAGCASVAKYIFASNLEGYYEKRDKLPGKALFLAEKEDLFADDSFVKETGELREATLQIEGIHCAACVWLLEKVTSRIEGVAISSVNFSTHEMAVKWSAHKTSLKDIIKKINSLGYKASAYDRTKEAALDNGRTDILVRMSVAGFCAAASMFLAEGLYAGYFWGIEESYKGFLQWLSLFVAVPVVFYSGFPFVSGALRGLLNRAMTMDLPIALGSLITFFYSVWATIKGRGDVYFDSVVMFIFLILIGRFLEAGAKRKAGNAISRLRHMAVEKATLVKDGVRTVVPARTVTVGDILEVKPGERVPLDGIITEGLTSVDESLLTGESKPVVKEKGSEVFGATINTDGVFLFEVTKAGGDTRLSGITKLLENAQVSKASIQKLSDRIAGYFVPIILAAAVCTFIYWYLNDPSKAVVYSVAVLIVTCPCALALATPAAVLAACGEAARKGIFIKSGEALEKLHKATHVVFDKTGTLTQGRMLVTDVISARCNDEKELLGLAGTLEQFSEHPIGKAIHEEALKRGAFINKAEGFRAYPGRGAEAFVRKTASAQRTITSNIVHFRDSALKEKIIAGSSAFFIKERCIYIPADLLRQEQALSGQGKSVVYIAKSSQSASEVMGLIAVSDPLRAESEEAVKRLKSMGLTITMLTGDNRLAAQAIAGPLGIENVIAGVMPEDKENVIRKIKGEGWVVVMVGDGINDGPALARADVGIAIGSGADIAISSADIVLLNSNPMLVVDSIRTSRNAFKAVKGNLMISFVYNIIMTPLAALGFIVPVLAAVAMPLSSLAVIGNSLWTARER